jgi:parallel beta-helix repeat protein
MPVTAGANEIWPAALWDNGGMVRNAKHPDFGAWGDGTHDDTAALQACLTASLTKGDVVVIPPGDYRVTAPLIPPASNAFMNSSKHRIILHGARLFSYDATAGRDILNLSSYYGQEGSLTIEGGTVDGANATGTTNGVAIHSMNTVLQGTVVRNCLGTGVRWVNDLAAPPICCTLISCLIQKNGIGVWSAVPTSNLVLLGNRIEGNGSEGVLLDNCGKATLLGNTIENNGFVTATKNNLKITNAVDFYVSGNYFEDNAYQGHSSVLIEGNTNPGFGGVFCGNRVVGYYETSSGSGVALTAAIGLDIAGGAGGAVDSVVAFGNLYSGMYTAVRVNTNARAYALGPDYFSDNFNPSFVTPACIRYSRISANAGIVNDVNRFAALVYNTATLNAALINTLTTSGLHTAAGGVRVTGGSALTGSMTKSAALGLLFEAVAGSTADFTIVDPTGAAVYEVPTGTKVSQFFATVQETAATITYSTSMTPNAAAGNIQTITATDAVAFAINAPTGPRAGMRLRIRIRNTTAGALGAATWNAAFKLGAAWTQPANGFSRSIDFDYNGTVWVEAFRSAVDVAN